MLQFFGTAGICKPSLAFVKHLMNRTDALSALMKNSQMHGLALSVIYVCSDSSLLELFCTFKGISICIKVLRFP